MPHYRSRTSTHGRNMAGARGLWRATGMKDSDFGKPIIAIANSFTQFVPGHVHLKDLGQLVAREIEQAGGVAKEFNTIALAAGHRPCFFCRRADAVAFREAWAAGHQCSAPKASEMDAVLHRQRLDEHLRKRLHPPPMALSALPDGTMVADAGQSYLLLRGEILLWTEHGYRITHTPLSAPSLLTPPATVLALMSGYRPHIAAQNIPAPEPGSANDAH